MVLKTNDLNNNREEQAYTHRNNRYMDVSPIKNYNKQDFEVKNLESKSLSIWAQEIEQKIADFFDKKNIVALTEMLCKSDESPLYVRKKISSPLYIHFGGTRESLNQPVKEKIGLVETAIYLLLNDDSTNFVEISRAYQILLKTNSIYQPPAKLFEEFQKKLGIYENTQKTSVIIQKLKEAGQHLGFNN